MKNLLLLLFFIPIHVFCQKYTVDRPDELIEPGPYTKCYFEDKNDYKRVESIITITKYKYEHFRADTLRIVYYNHAGLPFKNIRYDYNKESSTTLQNYDTHNNLLSWQTFEKKTSILTLYFYNKANQLQETRQLRINLSNPKNDSSEISRMVFKYDDFKLVEIANLHPGNKLTEQYVYDNKKLVRKTGGFIAKAFQYDDNGNISSIQEYMGTDVVPEKLMGIKKFTNHKTNRLVTDSVLTSSNLLSKQYQVSQYTYNTAGMLEQMRVTYGSAYRNTVFAYSNNRMTAVNMETNEANSAYLRFGIHHKIADYYSFPIHYQEIFSYDSTGNRIAKKVFVNKELFSETEYIIKYKK